MAHIEKRYTVYRLEAEQYDRRLSAIVDGLNAVAEEVRNKGIPTSASNPFSQAAIAVFDVISSTLYRLDIDLLIETAVRADLAKEETI